MAKKHLTKLFNILLAVIVFTLLLAACGDTTNNTSSEPISTKPQTQSSDETDAETQSQDFTETVQSNTPEIGETPEPTVSESDSGESEQATAIITEENNKPEETKSPVSGNIRIWYSLNYTEAVGFSSVTRSFIQYHPGIEFEIRYVPFNELRSKFETAAANGEGPDLIIGADDWGPAMYDAGFIADLTDVEVTDIDEIAMSIGNYKDAQIGLPYVLKGVVMYRNKNLLPEPASSYEDLKAKSKAATTSNIYGALLETSSFYSLGHLYGLGGELMTADGDPAFNTPEGQAWLEMLQDFHNLGADPLNADYDYSMFRKGRAGVIIDGTWNLGDLYAWLKDNLVIDPWPSGMSGFVQAGMIFLNNNSEGNSRDAAKAFLAYLFTKEAQTSIYKADRAFIPVNTAVEIDDPLRKQVQTAFKNGVAWIVMPEMSVYWKPIDDAIFGAVVGGVDPQHLLATAEQDILNALAEYRSSHD